MKKPCDKDERIRKNRESARRSIEKKRMYTQHLENTTKNLYQENDRLKSRLLELEKVVQDLKDEIHKKYVSNEECKSSNLININNVNNHTYFPSMVHHS